MGCCKLLILLSVKLVLEVHIGNVRQDGAIQAQWAGAETKFDYVESSIRVSS